MSCSRCGHPFHLRVECPAAGLQNQRDNALALAGEATQRWEQVSTENGALKRRLAELELALVHQAAASRAKC
jgi:hypothetical protein